MRRLQSIRGFDVSSPQTSGKTSNTQLPHGIFDPVNGPSIGIAYSPDFPDLIRRYPNVVDYVEMPFELLHHSSEVLEGINIPIVLHCASLSIAGTVAPADDTLTSVARWVAETRTPWLGEHLAFVLAEKSDAFPDAEEYAAGAPYNIGYTASPPMNADSLDLVVANLNAYSERFKVPLLIENSPLYFKTPGSTMSQSGFIRGICDGCSVGLLFDLTHFLITSRNSGFNPFEEILKYPLDRVVEIHVSGTEFQNGIHWDNHAAPVPDEVFTLLEVALNGQSVRAVTLEYNWISRFPESKLVMQINRVRELIKKHSTHRL